MGGFLFGSEKSGTPVETRGGTTQIANLLQGMLARQPGQPGGPEGVAAPFGRLTNEAWVNMLGFDPREIGLDEASIAALADPRDSTAGLFAAMQPFEQQETERQAAGLRQGFGALGGRFGRNSAVAEGNLRGELSAQFGRNREQALLQAAGLRNNALASILAASTAARGQAFQEAFAPWQSTLNFFQPGVPVQQQGALPGMIGAGINLFGIMKMLQNQGGAPVGTTTAYNVPTFNGPSTMAPPGGSFGNPWTWG